MLATRPQGQGSASKKYDVLTALGVHACAGSKFQQRLILRFMTAITARYNWQRDELTMGRTELARLWQVDERTVKRELAKLKACGWLCVKRPAARGRVTAYSIDWDRILSDTRPCWDYVGPDFTTRLSTLAGAAQTADQPDRTVIAFPAAASPSDTEWDHALALLHRADPAFHANWLASVQRRALSQGILELEAPTAFQAEYLNTHAGARITRAVQTFAPQVHRVIVRPA